MSHREKRVIYSINVDDVQRVSAETFGKLLTSEQVTQIEDSLGEYIDWHSAIETAICEHIVRQRAGA